MIDSNDEFINNLDMQIHSNLDLTFCTNDLLEKYTADLNINESFESLLESIISSQNTILPSPIGISPENNNSNEQELLNVVSTGDVIPASDRLEMIAQPYYGKKLRYRSDYEKNENRLGVLKNRTLNSSYQGPAIRIPKHFLDPHGGYFICVSLVTVVYHKTNLHYIHPYELEHPTNEKFNNRSNNSVWIPIESEDCVTGIKSFPLLRIIKKRASDLKTSQSFRVFGCENINIENRSLPQITNAKDMIKEYRLDCTQLAFTVARQVLVNNTLRTEFYSTTTVFSEEMIEGGNDEIDSNSDAQSPNDKPVLTPSLCRVYKYAPKYGYDQNEEDMVIFLTTKPEPKKYGDIQIKFQSAMFEYNWCVIISELDIKDRMLSFKTPLCPYQLNELMPVDISIQQNNRVIETIKYFYIPRNNQCSNCLQNAVGNANNNAVLNMPTKRQKNMLHTIDFPLDDGPIPKFENSKSSSESVQNSASSSTEQSSNTLNPSEQMMKKLAVSVESVFLDNDYSNFFRACRAFLFKSPELIHQALDRNHIDLLLKFIPTSLNEIIQIPNEHGETLLLHAIRLDHLEIIKVILKRKKFDILLDSIDNNKNNLFHIIALYSISSETIQWLIDYFHENSINLTERFDHFNNDHWTPLQLAICKNNLLATKYFLPYFKANIYDIKNSTGDNLIHLAVRNTDLNMVKYLIDDGHLFEQGQFSNLNYNPMELARSLQRYDMVEYFQEIYPQQEIEDDEDEDEN